MKAPRPPKSMTLDMSGGRRLNIREPHARDRRGVTVVPKSQIQRLDFDQCPICFEPATNDEHVPPASIGGRVMTRTCEPCNNKLGSHVEADLADWYDHVLASPRISAENVQGSRRARRLVNRITDEGEFVLVIEGPLDPNIVEALKSGRIELTADRPDRNRSRLGLLKHAYLAACLHRGAIIGPSADSVRADLLAARDARRRGDVPLSDLALGLTVLRSEDGPWLDWPLVHAAATVDDEEIEGVILGGTTFVSWPAGLL